MSRVSTKSRDGGKPGWLERRFQRAVDGLLQQRGIDGTAAEALRRAERLTELGLDQFASPWQEVAAELARRARDGYDA